MLNEDNKEKLEKEDISEEGDPYDIGQGKAEEGKKGGQVETKNTKSTLLEKKKKREQMLSLQRSRNFFQIMKLIFGKAMGEANSIYSEANNLMDEEILQDIWKRKQIEQMGP